MVIILEYYKDCHSFLWMSIKELLFSLAKLYHKFSQKSRINSGSFSVTSDIVRIILYCKAPLKA